MGLVTAAQCGQRFERTDYISGVSGGLVGLRDTLKYPGTVWLMNISDPHCPFQPLALTVGEVKKGCAVCDQGCLQELLRENLTDTTGVSDASLFNPGEKMFEESGESRKDLVQLSDVVFALETGACSLALKHRRMRRLESANQNQKKG